jgi:hypothetical protein
MQLKLWRNEFEQLKVQQTLPRTQFKSSENMVTEMGREYRGAKKVTRRLIILWVGVWVTKGSRVANGYQNGQGCRYRAGLK